MAPRDHLTGAMKVLHVVGARPNFIKVAPVLAELRKDGGTHAQCIPVVFPLHPRTRARLSADPSLRARADGARGLKLAEPIGYLDFLALTANARLVMTDSGGIQEETTALGVPCLTIRRNTERPVTVEVGTNALVGTDPAQVVPAAMAVLDGRGKKGRVPELWDGRAAERIAPILIKFCEERGR